MTEVGVAMAGSLVRHPEGSVQDPKPGAQADPEGDLHPRLSCESDLGERDKRRGCMHREHSLCTLMCDREYSPMEKSINAT